MTQLLRALVYSIKYEARDIVSVELRATSPDIVLPSYEAGAHIDLHLGDNLVRSYSLCQIDDRGQRYVVSVLNDRASRGGSRYVHEKLRVGQTLMISPPRNNFRLHERAEKTVLVAGGIGVTPIHAMLQRLRQLDMKPEIIYSARSRREAAFCKEIVELAGDRVTWHFDDERDGPPDLKALLTGYDPSTHFYCCGPQPMLDAYERCCAELGYPNAHLERFSAPAKETEAARTGRRSSVFHVELRRSGGTLEVPSDKSILQVLLAAGLDVDHSCEQGICGYCETRVIEGDVDHRDFVLSNTERADNKLMMVCVSRSKSDRLVLDR